MIGGIVFCVGLVVGLAAVVWTGVGWIREGSPGPGLMIIGAALMALGAALSIILS